eukprot:m.12430 g.12430  ORF g.12430 m.12430 type:complete len:481 (-) comp4545_c0_seq2:80-1522(-)
MSVRLVGPRHVAARKPSAHHGVVVVLLAATSQRDVVKRGHVPRGPDARPCLAGRSALPTTSNGTQAPKKASTREQQEGSGEYLELGVDEPPAADRVLFKPRLFRQVGVGCNPDCHHHLVGHHRLARGQGELDAAIWRGGGSGHSLVRKDRHPLLDHSRCAPLAQILWQHFGHVATLAKQLSHFGAVLLARVCQRDRQFRAQKAATNDHNILGFARDCLETRVVIDRAEHCDPLFDRVRRGVKHRKRLGLPASREQALVVVHNRPVIQPQPLEAGVHVDHASSSKPGHTTVRFLEVGWIEEEVVLLVEDLPLLPGPVGEFVGIGVPTGGCIPKPELFREWGSHVRRVVLFPDEQHFCVGIGLGDGPHGKVGCSARADQHVRRPEFHWVSRRELHRGRQLGVRSGPATTGGGPVAILGVLQRCPHLLGLTVLVVHVKAAKKTRKAQGGHRFLKTIPHLGRGRGQRSHAHRALRLAVRLHAPH